MPITALPTAPTPRVTELERQTVFIYGMPGIGKSTFCGNAEKALIIATEAGLNHLTVTQQPVTTWEEFNEVCALLAKGGHTFRNVTIDTIDNLLMLASDWVCRANRVKHIAELEDKRGYSMLNNEIKRVLTKLSLLDCGLYLVGHAKLGEVKNARGVRTQMWMPSINETNTKNIVGLCDIVMFAEMSDEVNAETGEVTGQTRVLRTQPTNRYIAKSRVANLPATLPLDYAAFVAAYTTAVKGGK